MYLPGMRQLAPEGDVNEVEYLPGIEQHFCYWCKHDEDKAVAATARYMAGSWTYVCPRHLEECGPKVKW